MDLYISSRFQLFRIIKSKDGIYQSRCQIASPFASFYYQFGDMAERFHHVFAFANVHKAHRSSDDAAWMRFSFRIRSHSSINAVGALPNTYKASGCSSAAIRIPACVRVIPFLCQCCRAFVTQIAFHPDAHPFQSTFTDARGSHRHIRNNCTYFSFIQYFIQTFYGKRIYMQYVFHLEIGCGMDGMQ